MQVVRNHFLYGRFEVQLNWQN